MKPWEQEGGVGDVLRIPGLGQGEVLQPVLLTDDLGPMQGLGGGAQGVEEFLEQIRGHDLVGIGDKAPVLVLPQRGDRVGLGRGPRRRRRSWPSLGTMSLRALATQRK